MTDTTDIRHIIDTDRFHYVYNGRGTVNVYLHDGEQITTFMMGADPDSLTLEQRLEWFAGRVDDNEREPLDDR